MKTALQQALQLIKKGDLYQAEQLLTKVNEQQPKQEELLSLLGHTLMKQGKYSAAVNIFETLVNYYPKSHLAFGELGSALLSLGNLEQAEKSYQKAIELNNNYSEAWHLLGNLLMKKGDRKNAISCFSHAQLTDPFRSHFIQIQQYMDNEEYFEAEKSCREVLAKHPNHAQALFTLAKLANQLDVYEEAINILQFGLRYSPYHSSLLNELIKNYSSLGSYEQAIRVAEKLVDLEPENTAYLNKLAENLAYIGHNEKSLTIYQKAHQLAPEKSNFLLQIGHMQKILGHRQACEQSYRKCTERENIAGAAFWALADLKSYHFSPEDNKEMFRLMKDPSISKEQSSQAGFALAKALEDENDLEQSFQYYQQANAMRPNTSFSATDYSEKCIELADYYTADLLNKQRTTSEQGPTPIFIVGLPRSGSTLIEQILSSHSAIEGTMELFNLPRLVRKIDIRGKKHHKPYPEAMTLLNSEELQALGQCYLDETKVYRTDKPFFIDKSPPNFHNIGLIHMILPNAIIIDSRRHPLSTGFSNFKQHYAIGHDFSYDLNDIGKYFNSYVQLMDHWQQVLPGKVLCMHYEDMVKNTEQQVKLLLQHCGLPFEEVCLNFYQNKRPVRTSSSEQVRQPINHKGISQWQRFDSFLGPLKKSLGETTLQRFAPWQ